MLPYIIECWHITNHIHIVPYVGQWGQIRYEVGLQKFARLSLLKAKILKLRDNSIKLQLKM